MAELPLRGGANPADRGMEPETGLLVTNHMNMMFMISSGLIMPPAGFGEKYYKDTLGDFPGWIPVFIKNAFKQAIDDAAAEENFLIPCIFEIKLSGLSGQALAYGSAGLEEIRFPVGFKESHNVLLLPGPLPVSRIESVVFRSNDEKRAVETSARDYNNVRLSSFKTKTGKRLFTSSASSAPWPLPNGPESLSPPLSAAFAAGGVMAMLLSFGNLGDQAVQACRIAFSPDDVPRPRGFLEPILSGLRPWIKTGKATPPESSNPEVNTGEPLDVVQVRLLWGAVERLAKLSGPTATGKAGPTIIEFLSEVCSELGSERREHMMKLSETLTSLEGLPEFTPNELFDRHPATLDRAFILFYLREKCDDLLDYENDRLTERDWLAAAILFGVRDGWLKLPNRLRYGRDLVDAVSHRMARLSHQIANTGLELGKAPPRPRPLRELFGEDSDWRSKEKKAALALARNENWNCINTSVTLRTGEYKLFVKGTSVRIELPGEPKVTPEIDKNNFFKMLAVSRLDDESAAPIRKLL